MACVRKCRDSSKLIGMRALRCTGIDAETSLDNFKNPNVLISQFNNATYLINYGLIIFVIDGVIS